MAKKDNHLLLYSNVNTLDFADINAYALAKAWTVLFHFRGKSTESMLYEEFNSIAQRNTISKTKNHEVFNKLYLKLSQECYKHNLQMDMAGSCERTGWPIDIRLSHFFFKKQPGRVTSAAETARQEADGSNSDQMYAVYFLLQEEICYNADSKQEEPLGLQKLMLRHLSQISNFKVCTVDENMTASHLESSFNKIQDEFYPLLYSPRKKSSAAQAEDQRTASDRVTFASEAVSQEQAPYQMSSLDDFVSTSSEDSDGGGDDSGSELDDIVDIPQSML